MRQQRKRQGGNGSSPSSTRQQCLEEFEALFGRAWDAVTQSQVQIAVETRKQGFLLLRELNRVAVGFAALRRIVHDVPPPEEDPEPPFAPDRKRDERYLLAWAFEEGLIPFAAGPVTPRALAVVGLLMGYEQDSPGKGAIARASERMRKLCDRRKQQRAPTPPDTDRLVAETRELKLAVRERFDALAETLEGIVR